MKQLILCSQIVWLAPVALTFAGFGLCTTRAIAQTTFLSEAVYDTVIESEEIKPHVSEVTVSGESADASYGLTNLKSMSYFQLDSDNLTGLTSGSPPIPDSSGRFVPPPAPGVTVSTFTPVPEPGTETGILAGTGAISAFFLLRRCYQRGKCQPTGEVTKTIRNSQFAIRNSHADCN